MIGFIFMPLLELLLFLGFLVVHNFLHYVKTQFDQAELFSFRVEIGRALLFAEVGAQGWCLAATLVLLYFF
jgi:hypothetical protein